MKNTPISLIRRISVVLLFTLCATAGAQNGFNLPYSQFGLSETHSAYNSPLGSGIGGALYATRGYNTINPYNPASYSAIEMESMVLDIGMSLRRYRQSDAANSISDFDGSLSHLALAFPLTKWWKTAVGLTPHNETEYESTYHGTMDDGTQVNTIYDGNGSIYRAFWGNGFNITPRLTVGFNLNYLYGDIDRGLKYDILGSDTSHYADSRRVKHTHISSLAFDLGAQYQMPIDEKRSLTWGLTVSLPRKMSTHDTAWVYTLVEGSDAANSIIDSTHYASDATLPLGVGFGVAYEYDQLWRLAADLHYAPWHGMKYEEGLTPSVFPQSNVDYTANYRAALAVSWLGNRNASSYWQRIGISAGVHYDYGRLALLLTSGNERVDEWGAGMNFSFPIRKGRSKIQLSMGYSSMGSKDLLRVECYTFGLTLSSCEQWFVKRKYN